MVQSKGISQLGARHVVFDDETGEGARKSKRERFLTVAEKRTVRVLRGLRLLGNCGNRNAYEYSEKEANKIFDAIQSELDRARERFVGPTAIEFSLAGDDDDGAEDNDL